MTEKIPMIVLAGPTAVGKTDLSIALAKEIGGEIISCDSMQVYKYMDIGSAKITKEDMQGIPHYLVDVLDPGEPFHVARFQEMAKDAIKEIRSHGKIPIAVGGTGFYIQALLYDAQFSEEEENLTIRRELEKIAREREPEILHKYLMQIDPVSAANIHPNNVKRVIRAIEFYQIHKMPISLHNRHQKEKESPYDFCYFVLNDERERLYDRIDKRVDQMMKDGLMEEVKGLHDMGYTRDMVSMQGLGYKELIDVLEGRCTLEEAVYLIKRDTRHFAKRQLTWFHGRPEVIWVNKQEFDHDRERILAFMKEKWNTRNMENEEC